LARSSYLLAPRSLESTSKQIDEAVTRWQVGRWRLSLMLGRIQHKVVQQAAAMVGNSDWNVAQRVRYDHRPTLLSSVRNQSGNVLSATWLACGCRQRDGIALPIPSHRVQGNVVSCGWRVSAQTDWLAAVLPGSSVLSAFHCFRGPLGQSVYL